MAGLSCYRPWRCVMATRVVTINDVLDGHVGLDLKCFDRIASHSERCARRLKVEVDRKLQVVRVCRGVPERRVSTHSSWVETARSSYLVDLEGTT